MSFLPVALEAPRLDVFLWARSSLVSVWLRDHRLDSRGESIITCRLTNGNYRLIHWLFFDSLLGS